MRSPFVFIFVLGWIASSVNSVLAQTPSNQDESVDVKSQEILSEHLKWLGNLEQLEDIRSVISEGTLEMAANGIRFRLRLSQFEGKYLLELKSDRLEIRQGFDGDVVWETGSTGTRILSGDERTAALQNNSSIIPALEWTSHDFPGKIKYAGRQMVENKNCHAVDFHVDDGQPVRRYFDPDTFQMLRYRSRHSERDALLPDQTRFIDTLIKDSDWRYLAAPFDSVRMPFRQQFAVDNQLVYTIELRTIRLNRRLDSSLFEVPGEMRHLIKD